MDPALLTSLNSSVPSNADMVNMTSDMGGNLLSMIWQRRQYERQRRDALDFWNKQNEYNAPVNQMARLRAAGLNPNLMYGQGNVGNSQAIDVPDTQPLNFRSPRVEGSNDALQALLGVADLRIKNAQATNLETSTENIRQEGILKSWLARRAGLDYSLEEELYQTNADARRAGLEKTKVETDLMINRDVREAIQLSSNISEAAERILSMRDQRATNEVMRAQSRAETARIRENIRLLEKEGILKNFDIELRRQGIMPNDPLWARYSAMFLSDIVDGRLTPSTIAGSMWSFLTGFIDRKNQEALKYVHPKR